MRPRRIVNTRLTVLVLLLLRVSPALAQSAIAGVVKDTSGAVIPGVTVVASSPALIEKTTLNRVSPGNYPEVPEGGAIWVFAVK